MSALPQRWLYQRGNGFFGATDGLSAVFMAITARKMSTTRRSWLYRRDYGYNAATFRFFAAFMALSAPQWLRRGAGRPTGRGQAGAERQGRRVEAAGSLRAGKPQMLRLN
jgi:hypothetical protein